MDSNVKPSTTASYVLIALVGFGFITLLASFLAGGLIGLLAEVGRLMLGMTKR